LSDSVLELELRKYPGSHIPAMVAVTLDCVARTARVGGSVLPMRQAEAALEAMLTWPQPIAAEPPRGFAGWLKRPYNIWRGKH
jgi:hypothetical protein